MLPAIDLLLVIGSRNSSNSCRLVEVARDFGVPSYLIDDETEIDEAWLEGVETLGVTSGASAPDSLVRRVLGGCEGGGVPDVRSFSADTEDATFKLPVEIRRAGAEPAAASA